MRLLEIVNLLYCAAPRDEQEEYSKDDVTMIRENMRLYKKIEVLAEKVDAYIVDNWNLKEITPEIGLKHWLFIQEISKNINEKIK